MCINCNIPAPVNHFICELIGIEKTNMASHLVLSHLLIMMKYEFSNSWDIAADLKQHLDDRNLYDLLKEAVFADGINYAAPSDLNTLT